MITHRLLRVSLEESVSRSPGKGTARTGPAGRTVTDRDLDITTYTYDDAGRMTSATPPNGTGVVSTGRTDIPR
ncbi:MAG: RHS repeat protein [Dehalococcoidia bacterium]|nr:RHS repeat protein [Dehalococcoidia bacterium]